jgi:hypothetical protein
MVDQIRVWLDALMFEAACHCTQRTPPKKQNSTNNETTVEALLIC